MISVANSDYHSFSIPLTVDLIVEIIGVTSLILINCPN